MIHAVYAVSTCVLVINVIYIYKLYIKLFKYSISLDALDGNSICHPYRWAAALGSFYYQLQPQLSFGCGIGGVVIGHGRLWWILLYRIVIRRRAHVGSRSAVVHQFASPSFLGYTVVLKSFLLNVIIFLLFSIFFPLPL